MNDVIHISHPDEILKGSIRINGSKSESNRLLILSHLYSKQARINSISNSNDTQLLKNALACKSQQINVGDAGTSMRFLTALLAVKGEGEYFLSGSKRMHQRPIGVLVDALIELGAKISYDGKKGYPPLKIVPAHLAGGPLRINGSISSQFISALMMIGPSMEKGLHLFLEGEIVSRPYLALTASLMKEMGFSLTLTNNEIIIKSADSVSFNEIDVEADWSSASYYYSLAALSKYSKIILSGLKENSLQGDSVVRNLFQKLGVKSTFNDGMLILEKTRMEPIEFLEFDLIECPDLAQTIAVSLVAMQVSAKIRGLQTLKIKETDRLVALKKELEKTGAKIEIDEDSLTILSGMGDTKDGLIFETYDDHRMAMSLAPLALKAPVSIKKPQVVRKSYPNFWKDLEVLGFNIDH